MEVETLWGNKYGDYDEGGKSMEKNLIGILAGMGPKSSAPFVDMLIDECQKQYGARLDDEFPSMMIYTIPTAFNKDHPIDHNLMKKIIKEGLIKLQDAGVSFVAMPFSSAYVYYEELQREIRIPLLNMISETIQQIPSGVKKAAVFATEETITSGIYQRKLEFSGYQFVFTTSLQQKVDELIHNMKMDSKNSFNKILWHELIKEAEELSADCIIIDSANLEGIVDKEHSRITIVSAVESLSEAAVRSYRTGLISRDKIMIQTHDKINVTLDIQE